jgi:hypothetical protein
MANSLHVPIYEKLDRVLMDTDWEDKYPIVSVRALECIEKLSDHAPILVTTGTPRPLCKCRGDDLGGAPRAGQYAGWRPRNPRGFGTRRPAPLEGPAAPAAG